MGCAYWLTTGELARISLIGQEWRQVLVTPPTYVLTHTHAMVLVEDGGRMRGEGVLL